MPVLPPSTAARGADPDMTAPQQQSATRSRASTPSPSHQSVGGPLSGLTVERAGSGSESPTTASWAGAMHEPLPIGAVTIVPPRLITALPPRPPGQLSPATRRQNVFQGTSLTIKVADQVVLPHVLHHMTDSGNDGAINKNGFDHSKAKKDPENRFAFDPSEASQATSEELEQHTSRSRSVFFGLGETDRKYMQAVKHEDKEQWAVETTIHHALIPSGFQGKLVPDEANPPGRNYHRIEGSVPAACVVAEPVESRPLALMAVEEHLKNAGYTGVSAAQVRDYTSYIIEKFHDEERFGANDDLQAVETARANEAQP